MAPAQLVGGAAACASEADEGCAGFDWWSLDPNNTKMVHLLNMAVCSHDRMMSCRVDGDCSFHEASSNVSRRANTSSLARFPSTASSTRTVRGPIPLWISRSSGTPS